MQLTATADATNTASAPLPDDTPPTVDDAVDGRDRPLDLSDDTGAQAMEYALLAGAAVVVVLVLIQLFRGEFFGGMLENLVRSLIDRVISSVTGDGGGGLNLPFL